MKNKVLQIRLDEELLIAVKKKAGNASHLIREFLKEKVGEVKNEQ